MTDRSKRGSVKYLTKEQITAFQAGRIRLNELASEIGVKPPTLSRYFKRQGIQHGSVSCPRETVAEKVRTTSCEADTANQFIQDSLNLLDKAGQNLTNAWDKVIDISIQQLDATNPRPSAAVMRQIVQNLTAAREGLGIPPLSEIVSQSFDDDKDQLPKLIIERMSNDEEEMLRNRREEDFQDCPSTTRAPTP